MVKRTQPASRPARAKGPAPAAAAAEAAKPAAATPAPASPAPAVSDQSTAATAADGGTPLLPVSEGESSSGTGEQAAGAVIATDAADMANTANATDTALVAVIGELGDVLPQGVLVVIGPREGRRRAGRTFGREPTYIARDEIDDAGVLAITGDPFLQCSVVLPEKAGK